MLHFTIPLSAGIGALFQFSFDFSIYRQVFLVADGMLKACPEVHVRQLFLDCGFIIPQDKVFFCDEVTLIKKSGAF